MFYERILRELQRQKVRYLLIGGVAVNLHGYDRITGDLDIIISMTDTNIKKFIAVAKKLGLKPRIPVKIEDFAVTRLRREWIKEKNMRAFLVANPGNPAEHLDIVIEHPVNFSQAYRRREKIKSGGLKMPLIAVEDLIKMKAHAGRERDLTDIKALTRIKELKYAKKKES